MTDNTTSYGFKTVNPDEKQGKVNYVFSRVADNYDLMNDMMSGGMHRIWKDELITQLAPRAEKPLTHLDVAGGTGDITFQLLQKAGSHAHVTILDISPEMLTVGRDRAREKQISDDQISFVEASAESLPFPDRHFDSYTIAFGIRNVPRIDLALKEARRALKPGGHFLCLEFSAVKVPILREIYDRFSFNVIPKMGEMIMGDAEPYQYLVESIRKFPDQESFKTMIEAAGLERVRYTNLTGGIAAIHSAWRI